MAYIGNSPVQDETVTSAQIVDGAIVDADVNSSAAIAFSKMANLTASRVLVSDGSGDVSVSNVTSAETLMLDGGTSATSTTLAAADRVIVNDNGTMVQVALSDFETFFEGAIDTLSSAMTFSSTVTVGSDGSGQDVIFYSGTSGDNFTWDSSEECLTITGTDGAQALKVADGDLVVVDKLYIYDNDGGEYLSGDGTTLTITAGAASTVKLDANSKISLSNNDSGTSNTILGKSAGASLDAGSNYNVFIGENVSDATMNDATNNVGVGYQALSALTTGDKTVAIGYNAGVAITTGGSNTFVGNEAGEAATDTGDLVLIGKEAGTAISHTDANGTVCVGYESGKSLVSGIGNVAIGANALDAEDDGDFNTAIGHQALTAQTGTSGTVSNTAVGYQAGLAITKGRYNTIIGKGALVAEDVGDETTAVGTDALGSQNSDSDNETTGNTGIGKDTGYHNVTGTNNTLIGYKAGQGASGESNSRNTAVGANALLAITTGGTNVAVGDSALKANTSASDNTAVGLAALEANSTGHSNVAVGAIAALTNTTGQRNVAVGHQSFKLNQSGSYNTAVGRSALFNNTTAHSNTAIGYEALYNNDEGANNTALGTGAGDVITTGSNNVCIGKSTDTTANNGDNQIVIGYNFTGNGDTKVSIGSDSGYVWNGYTSDNAWAQVSDVRLKKNINDDELGLEFINEIRPVTFNWKPQSEVDPEFIEWSANNKGEKDTETLVHGLVAQEVKAAMDKVGNTTFNGWEDTIDGQAVKREMFITPLIKAVQELSQQVEELKKKVGE